MTHSNSPSTTTAPTIVKLVPVLILITAMFANQFLFLSSDERWSVSARVGAVESLPPALTLTVIALGPLRGLIANAIWWRIVEQQDQGNYFEINQLAHWITVMQPRNAQVWVYQGWNLAFNMSAEFPDAKSKWKWVLQGIRLMSNEGLKINPDSQAIKNEIAKTFFDRIGLGVDEHSAYFQKQWALSIVNYLPEGDRQELEAIAAAPDSKAELIAHPDVKRTLEEATKLDLDLLDRHVFYNFQTWSAKQRERLMDDSDNRKGLRIIDAFFRARGLKTEFNLNVARMLYIDREYGPFDWRLWQAYVVYWAATGSFADYMKQGLNHQTLVRQAMQRSFVDGELIFDPVAGVFITTNNFKIIGKLHDYYDYVLEHDYSAQADDIHKRFLQQASAVLYTFNRVRAARDVYDHYYEDYEQGERKPDFERFIAENTYKFLHSKKYQSTRQLVESALFQAYNWMATGDARRAVGYANYAKLVWNRHQKNYAWNPARLLPPFDDLKVAAYQKLMSGNAAPVFKERLQKAAEREDLGDGGTGGDSLYMGKSIKDGAGHAKFRERLKDREVSK